VNITYISQKQYSYLSQTQSQKQAATTKTERQDRDSKKAAIVKTFSQSEELQAKQNQHSERSILRQHHSSSPPPTWLCTYLWLVRLETNFLQIVQKPALVPWLGGGTPAAVAAAMAAWLGIEDDDTFEATDATTAAAHALCLLSKSAAFAFASSCVALWPARSAFCPAAAARVAVRNWPTTVSSMPLL
jgi:hypothetical protein